MRRILMVVGALAAAAALATTLGLLLRSPSASAQLISPLHGRLTGAAEANALATPLDRFGLELLAREARSTTGNVAVPIALGIFLDIFNVFLFFLQIFGGGGTSR